MVWVEVQLEVFERGRLMQESLQKFIAVLVKFVSFSNRCVATPHGFSRWVLGARSVERLTCDAQHERS